MRPTSIDTLKSYIKPGMRLRKVPAGGEPEAFTVERKSQMACIFDPTDARPNGFAMVWPHASAVRFDEAGFDKLDSKGEVLVRYEWVDPDNEEAPAEAPETAPD